MQWIVHLYLFYLPVSLYVSNIKTPEIQSSGCGNISSRLSSQIDTRTNTVFFNSNSLVYRIIF